MVPTALVSKLPLTESFEPGYLEYWGILPLELDRDRLQVAAVGEPAREVIEDLELTYGRSVEVVVVDRQELFEGIRRTFAAAESVVELVKDFDAAVTPDGDAASDGLADVRDLANQPPVIRGLSQAVPAAVSTGRHCYSITTASSRGLR